MESALIEGILRMDMEVDKLVRAIIHYFLLHQDTLTAEVCHLLSQERRKQDRIRKVYSAGKSQRSTNV